MKKIIPAIIGLSLIPSLLFAAPSKIICDLVVDNFGIASDAGRPDSKLNVDCRQRVEKNLSSNGVGYISNSEFCPEAPRVIVVPGEFHYDVHVRVAVSGYKFTDSEIAINPVRSSVRFGDGQSSADTLHLVMRPGFGTLEWLILDCRLE